MTSARECDIIKKLFNQRQQVHYMPKGSFDLPAEDKALQLIEYNFIMPFSAPFPWYVERVFIMPEKC